MKSSLSTPSFDLSPNEILADKISTLAANIHAATYRFLVLIREFDEREAWAEMGAKTCAHWLNWRCGISVHTAREKIRVAHAIADLLKISASFQRGELSYSKVRAVTRVANKANEDILLNIALSGTASQLERVVRCELKCEREHQIKERTETAFENRILSWKKRGDGTVEFFGRLPAELAEHVINAIEANLPETQTPANQTPTQQNLANENAALEGPDNEVIQNQNPEKERPKNSVTEDAKDKDFINRETADTGTTPNTTENGVVENSDDGVIRTLRKNVSAEISNETIDNKPTLASRRADALVALCRSKCTGYEVTLHVAAGESLHANALDECGTIPIEAAKRICCDAAIVPVTEDASGNSLDIGRRTRKVPSAMHRVLEIRDKDCCRFPACTHTHFLQAHHIKHWASGGKTCVDNLVLLCWHHHHLVHEGGFDCRSIKHANTQSNQSNQSPRIVFVRPNGVLIPDSFQLPPASGDIEDDNDSQTIDQHSCDARDYGTRLDVDVVIDALEFVRQRDLLDGD